MNQQPSNPSISLHGEELGTLAFYWLGDRHAHRWTIQRGDDVASLASVDEIDETGRCTSPPLQQIHLQEFPDRRRVAFGVGMAGRGHWSTSYTLVRDLACWIVEVACRWPTSPPWLGSTYVIDDRWEIDLEKQTAVRPLGDGRLVLQAITPTSTLQLAPEFPNRICISPASTDQQPATTQWAFRLRWSPDH